MAKTKLVLGIETSCDETAAAVVACHKCVLSNVVYSQIKEHKNFGGVVPEIAARAHMQTCGLVVERAINDAGITLSDITAVAATAGPGLIGGVLIGMQMAKAMAFSRNCSFIGVNHLQGHALVTRLTDVTNFPFLLLLISGGHTQLLVAKGVADYTILGTTLDDAAGEAFDKVAKILGLGYPGGAAIERRAKNGDKEAYCLPRPMKGKPNCHFSFSGLKTRVKQIVEGRGDPIKDRTIENMCASFQDAVAQSLSDRVLRAMHVFREKYGKGTMDFVVAGGVAANAHIRTTLKRCAQLYNFHFRVAPVEYCTDNAVMIAWAGIENLELGKASPLSMPARPRWSLEDL